MERRDKVLHGDSAAKALAAADPERWASLPEETRQETARQIVLHAIDRCWAEHLAFLTDLREGIHLRALGRMTRWTSSTGRPWPSTNRCRPRWSGARWSRSRRRSRI